MASLCGMVTQLLAAQPDGQPPAMGDIAGFLWGVVGGIFAELLGWYKLRQQSPTAFPAWAKSPLYWFLTLLMIAAGGLLVVIYLESDMPLKAILAVNVGASAPLILQSFLSQTPPINPGRVD